VLNLVDDLETYLLTMERTFSRSHIFFTDETWFQLSGYVNSQNSYIWSATNPYEINHYMITRLVCGVPYHEIG
jgi:hypothetical protein